MSEITDVLSVDGIKLEESENKVVLQDTPIYGCGLFKGIGIGKIKLNMTEEHTMQSKHYKWKLSYNIKEEEEKGLKSIVISAEITSRYLFDDEHQLFVTLERNGKAFKNEKYILNKLAEKEEFTIPFDTAWAVEPDQIDVFVYLSLSEIKYITSNWGTEPNLKDSTRTHDVVITIDETKFYVLRSYLATWSRYFDRLFFGEFKEKYQLEVKLEEVDVNTFTEVLQLIHPGHCVTISEGNVLGVLKLADRFDIPNLMARCGSLLCDFGKCKDLELIDRLELADKHNLVDLLVVCFKRIHSMRAESRIEFLATNRRRIQQLSTNTIKNII